MPVRGPRQTRRIQIIGTRASNMNACIDAAFCFRLNFLKELGISKIIYFAGSNDECLLNCSLYQDLNDSGRVPCVSCTEVES